MADSNSPTGGSHGQFPTGHQKSPFTSSPQYLLSEINRDLSPGISSHSLAGSVATSPAASGQPVSEDDSAIIDPTSEMGEQPAEFDPENPYFVPRSPPKVTVFMPIEPAFLRSEVDSYHAIPIDQLEWGPSPMLSVPPAQAQMSQANAHAQAMAAQAERENVKRRASKPTDLDLPEGLEEIVGPGAADMVRLHRRSRSIEKRLDAAMLRKRLELADSVNRNVKRYRTMRIIVSNEAHNQSWQREDLDDNNFDYANAPEPKFRLLVQGRLIEEDRNDDPTISTDEEDTDEDEEGKKDPKPKKKSKWAAPSKKFSDCFKSIVVEFDKRNESNQHLDTVEWHKPSATQPASTKPGVLNEFKNISIIRKSDCNVNCIINLTRLDIPERFRLSKELGLILDDNEADRATAVKAIYDYAKAMNLQEDEEKRGIRCDDWLQAIFHQETVFFPSIPELLAPHLTPLPPFQIPYTIRLDEEFHKNPEATIYDFEVEIDDPLRAMMNAALHNATSTEYLQKIQECDDYIAGQVQLIKDTMKKWHFHTSFAEDPVPFLRKWHASQARDLAIILGESGRGVEEAGIADEWRRGGDEGPWGTQEAKEAVAHFLARQDRERSASRP
ncbi:MAG: SWI/SNF complex component snf12 [Vezdaea aestivalis]|nr:MAG: SWI/SNF complex component snf12 [Vezdaea aestivalis]